MKATAIAPSNIAFIKYWGKRDAAYRIPANASISMNLSGAQTITTVEFSGTYSEDTVELVNGAFSGTEKQKVIAHLDRIRERASCATKARVVTKNSFPKGAGAASSASGFAALTIAGVAAAGARLTEKELTELARIGSGSACRSIPDGFVKWVSGNLSTDSYAYSLHPHTYWNIRDILVIVDANQKSIPTTAGMEGAVSSPFWKVRMEETENRIARVEHGLKTKNLQELGEAAEEDCLSMHAVAMTQNPPAYYWNDMTRRIMELVHVLRKRAIPVYFTIDAGPNVHLICGAEHEESVLRSLEKIKGILQVIINKPSRGAYISESHLF